MNFYDFVNQYRVEEAKQKLISSDYDHLSVLGIAFDCGFKSKPSFNRYFKKIYWKFAIRLQEKIGFSPLVGSFRSFISKRFARNF